MISERYSLLRMGSKCFGAVAGGRSLWYNPLMGGGPKPASPDTEEIIRVRQAVRDQLLPWFRRHQRKLPWRSRRTPYRVWISELMLQQTRVETVVGYYRRWMTRFPSLRALAEAPLQDVLKHWEGLGYYARARNAHRAAREIRANHGGRFPRSVAALQALPGIGPYTAAAIGSLSMGLPAAVVDGNVIRVLSRVYGLAEDVRRASAQRRLSHWARGHLPEGPPGEVNEAFMELGALLCTPRAPACPTCPLRTVCRAAKRGAPEAYPVKAAQKAVPHMLVGAGIVLDARGRFLLARRPEHKMLGGLWEFPGGRREPGETMPACVARELREELGLAVRVGPCLAVIRHAFSHFTMDLHAHWARIEKGRPSARECAEWTWAELHELAAYPMPKADDRIRNLLRSTPAPRF